MEHPNKPNNNQDDGGSMRRKRPVSADLDELSKHRKTSGISPIQLGHGPYGININQQRFSDHQLGPNFTQTPQLTLNVSQNNLIRNNNLLHFSVYPSHVQRQELEVSQFARAGLNVSYIRNSENPSSNSVAESSRQRENSEGPKGKGCKNCNCTKTKCLNL
ncbi:hypothetical protein IHE45_04G118500 [Dioscorea alata]|uniref:Uncharacterized protein n=1 Tax=Dioscorea alata TaxID=55571 RepID=A0ACB7WFH2_DIOAL|nr:hypothetical protein IHE45_04G118500 [Dioscorea alata]